MRNDNYLENGCGWCKDLGIMKHESFFRKRLINQTRVSVTCDKCKFSNQVWLDKDFYLRVYPSDTTYFRKLFKQKPNYVATIRNLDAHPNILDMLNAEPRNKS